MIKNMHKEEKEKKDRRKKILKTVFWIGVAGISLATIIMLMRSNITNQKHDISGSKSQKSAISTDEPKTALEANVVESTLTAEPPKPIRDDRKLISRCNRILKILAKDENNKIMISDEIDIPIESLGFRAYIFKHKEEDED